MFTLRTSALAVAAHAKSLAVAALTVTRDQKNVWALEFGQMAKPLLP